MTLPHPGTSVVINTGPLVACAIAAGDWSILTGCRLNIAVPQQVVDEIQAGPPGAPGRDLALPSTMTQVSRINVPKHLEQILDPGEASVIALALESQVKWVVIDELAGRRVARLHGLHVTGSLALLVMACRNTKAIDFESCVQAMKAGGVHLSDRVIATARSCLYE